MKKYAGILLGVVLLLVATGLAFAQEEGEFFYTDFEVTDRVNLGVRGGSVIPRMDGNYSYGFVTGAERVSSVEGKYGWFVGGELTYDLGDYFAIGAEGYYEQYKVDVVYTTRGIRGNLGTARNSLALGKFILMYPFDMEEYTFVPYVAGSAGGIFPDFKESTLTTNNNVSIGVKNGFAAKYGAGFDLYVTDNVAINVEGSFLDVDIKTAVTTTDGTANNDVKNDAWLVGGGLKYLF